MPLPIFTFIRVHRRELQNDKAVQTKPHRTHTQVLEDNTSEGTLTPIPQYKPGINTRRATRTRRNAIIISSLLFSLSVVFLILTIIGNTGIEAVIRSTYFFKLNLANFYPQAFIGAELVLVNSIARSLGLRDFYQVGLWSYCEGYSDEGITYCSAPTTMYWFNPVSILLSELLAGATMALPASITDTLALIKLASNLMFSFFLTSIILNLISIFITLLALYSCSYSLPLAIFTFITALLTAAATIIATVMSTIFKNVLTSQPGLNIGVSLGIPMMAFMWIATGATIAAFLIQLCLSCCCASRRDVRTGRRMGSNHAYGDVTPIPVEVEKTG